MRPVTDKLDMIGGRTRPVVDMSKARAYVTPSTPYHFQVVRVDEATVKVRCGTWFHHMPRNSTPRIQAADLAKNGGGTSSDYNDYSADIDLSGYGGGGEETVYISLKCDLANNTLVTDDANSNPELDLDDEYGYYLLATVSVNTGAMSSKIIQHWTGGHVTYFGACYDNKSVSIEDSTGQVEWHRLTDRASNMIGAYADDDVFGIYDTSDDYLKYITMTNLADAIDTYNKGDYWLRGEDYTKNYGTSIGKDAGTMVIDLTGGSLRWTGATYRLDWQYKRIYGAWTHNYGGTYTAILGNDASTYAGLFNVGSTSTYVTATVGGTLYGLYSTGDIYTTTGDYNTGNGVYMVAGTQVVGAQENHIADATTAHDVTGTDTVDQAQLEADLNALGSTINTILSQLEAHGLFDNA